MTGFPDNKNDELPTWTEIMEAFFKDWQGEEDKHAEDVYEAANEAVVIAQEETPEALSDEEVYGLAKRTFFDVMERRYTEALEEKVAEMMGN